MHETEFLEFCTKGRYDVSALSLFERGVVFAKKHLFGKKRLAGDSYFDHNVRVAYLLAESNAAPEIIAAGLLHGVLKECPSSVVEREFGREITQLVLEQNNIPELKFKNRELEAEALRKLILTTLHDVRVVIVKLANKVDNLRTIEVLPSEEQKRIAFETLEIYAPLAYRLGVENIRSQLEDLAFKIVNPRKYEEIMNYLEVSREDRKKDVDNVIAEITSVLRGKVDVVKIKGRPKTIYSIYRKITERGFKLNEMHDLTGIRIIAPEVKDCYIVLGLLHETYEPLEGKLKDYIAHPKPNFYRSLHTAVRMKEGMVVEVQIRTPEMDEFAEEGIAAHWRYKGLKSDNFFEKKIAWLRNVLDLQKDNLEFLETAKIDVFGDKIYCYTPKGEMKELPLGATILDFAYVVHEEIGNTAVGGRVNGTFVPLKHQLQRGDVVEIVTNKSQRPRRSWVKFVRSARARQKIRKYLNEHEKLAPSHFRLVKPNVIEDVGVLVESHSFPQAVCALAQCCHALPGEKIVGLATKRRVISVHREDCRAAQKEAERWVLVQWKDSFGQKIQFYVEGQERSGVLAEVLHTIATAGFSVKEAKAKMVDVGRVQCSFMVIPRDLEQLVELVQRVKKVRGIQKVYFE